MKLIKLLTAITLFAAITNASAQSTFWVSKTGSDDNNCTNATNDACLSIQKGISVATQPGDIVNIEAGTYVVPGRKNSFQNSTLDFI